MLMPGLRVMRCQSYKQIHSPHSVVKATSVHCGICALRWDRGSSRARVAGHHGFPSGVSAELRPALHGWDQDMLEVKKAAASGFPPV